MERTDWLDGGFDAREARFLMMTAITHHQFSSPIWGEDEVRKLQAELAEIDLAASRAFMDHRTAAAEGFPATSNAASSSPLPRLPRALPASR